MNVSVAMEPDAPLSIRRFVADTGEQFASLRLGNLSVIVSREQVEQLIDVLADAVSSPWQEQPGG
jgi:hypothetical protein